MPAAGAVLLLAVVIVVLSLVWIMALLVLVYVAPVMALMLKEFDVTTAPLDLILQRLIRTAPWWGLIVPLLVATYLAWVWRRSGRVTTGIDLHPWLSFGALKTLTRMQRASRNASLCDLLALLIDHDVPLPEALELASAAVGSPALAASGTG